MKCVIEAEKCFKVYVTIIVNVQSIYFYTFYLIIRSLSGVAFSFIVYINDEQKKIIGKTWKWLMNMCISARVDFPTTNSASLSFAFDRYWRGNNNVYMLPSDVYIQFVYMQIMYLKYVHVWFSGPLWNRRDYRTLSPRHIIVTDQRSLIEKIKIN